MHSNTLCISNLLQNNIIFMRGNKVDFYSRAKRDKTKKRFFFKSLSIIILDICINQTASTISLFFSAVRTYYNLLYRYR